MKWSCGLQVRVRSGPNRGVTFPIDSPVLKIGRARNPADRKAGWLLLHDETVSRLHCELFWQDDQQSFRLLHHSATNSTYVNGEIVENAELFDGDILEVGSTSLEIQKADLRWSQAKDQGVKEWADEPASAPQGDEAGLPTAPYHDLNETQVSRRIPGATVPTEQKASKVGVKIGPQRRFFLVSDEGEAYKLEGTLCRFGNSENAIVPDDEESPAKIPKFDSEYDLPDPRFSHYNLVLRYDELYLGHYATRVGPNAQDVTITRRDGKLEWHASLPESTEVQLKPGDQISVGWLHLEYKILDQ